MNRKIPLSFQVSIFRQKCSDFESWSDIGANNGFPHRSRLQKSIQHKLTIQH